jgi:hypothetical protein
MSWSGRKAELPIAEKLIAMGVPYVYEQPLVLGGRTRWPDFTIEDDASGITYYWEHLGMLSDPVYERRWAAKRQVYLGDGVRPVDEADGADRVLIETREVEAPVSTCWKWNGWPASCSVSSWRLTSLARQPAIIRKGSRLRANKRVGTRRKNP